LWRKKPGNKLGQKEFHGLVPMKMEFVGKFMGNSTPLLA